MKRLQRAQRDQKPRPAVPPATSSRKPANRAGKPVAAAKPVAKVTNKVAAKVVAKAAKPPVPPAPPTPPVVSEAQAVNKPPRRGLGNLGRQSLHRQQPTITLAVERPRALPLPDTTAYRTSAAVNPSGKSSGKSSLGPGQAGAPTAGLLQLRDGLRSLLSLLDAPPEATVEAEKM